MQEAVSVVLFMLEAQETETQHAGLHPYTALLGIRSIYDYKDAPWLPQQGSKHGGPILVGRLIWGGNDKKYVSQPLL